MLNERIHSLSSLYSICFRYYYFWVDATLFDTFFLALHSHKIYKMCTKSFYRYFALNLLFSVRHRYKQINLTHNLGASNQHYNTAFACQYIQIPTISIQLKVFKISCLGFNYCNRFGFHVWTSVQIVHINKLSGKDQSLNAFYACLDPILTRYCVKFI